MSYTSNYNLNQRISYLEYLSRGSDFPTGGGAIDPTSPVSYITGNDFTLGVAPAGTRKILINNNDKCINNVSEIQFSPTLNAASSNIRKMSFDSLNNRLYLAGQGAAINTFNGVADTQGICYYDFTTNLFVKMGAGTGGTGATVNPISDLEVDITDPNRRVYCIGPATTVNGTAITGSITIYTPGTNTFASPIAVGATISPVFLTLGARVLIDANYVYFFGCSGGFATNAPPTAPATRSSGIGRYNKATTNWDLMGNVANTGTESVFAAIIDSGNNCLWCGGLFASQRDVNNVAIANTLNFAKWNRASSTWTGYNPAQQLNGRVFSIGQLDANNLILTGAFTSPFPYAARYNISTDTFFQYGYSFGNIITASQRMFIDDDGLAWNTNTGGGAPTNYVGSTFNKLSPFLPLSTSLTFYTGNPNASWNNLVFLFTGDGGGCQPVQVIKNPFSLPGEKKYWVTGAIVNCDGGTNWGLNNFFELDKSKWGRVFVTNLIYGGGSFNGINFTVKNQLIELYSDGTNWIVSDTNQTANAVTGNSVKLF